MLEVRDLVVEVGRFRLGPVSLEVPAGTYCVLLGPTGCGKSVFVETICGFRRVRAGCVMLGGGDVTFHRPEERNVGYLPQDYMLFPRRKVKDNIEYGLRMRRLPETEIRARVEEVCDMLRIGHLLDRWPMTLSGGEQQRVALARALVVRPRLLILDEPTSAIDEAFRENVCIMLKRIQRSTGTTTLHVCHDFEEARIVGDMLCLMRDGAFVQVGEPDEVFRRPVDAETAEFLRIGNIMEGTISPDGVIACGGVRFSSPVKGLSGPVKFVVRSDEMSVHTRVPPDTDGNVIGGRVTYLSRRGNFTRLEVTMEDGCSVFVNHPGEIDLEEGDAAWLTFDPSAVCVWKS